MTEPKLPIAFVGAGAMGEAIVSGLLRSGTEPDQVIVCDPSQERLDTLTEQYGVRALDSAEAAAQAGTVVVAVKPKHVDEVLDTVGEHLRPGTVVVSIAAGIPTSFLEERLPDGTPVVRVMPNTPALLGVGMSAVSGGRHCSPDDLAAAEALMRSCGAVVTVPETDQDAVTAVSGSGPAYVFYVVEAMVEAGVVLGLPRATATELAVETVYGAATMLKQTGEHPSLLRERVSSPGGTTVAALRELDDHRVRAAFIAAVEAAARRSAELASG